jgi:type IV pilus assembly protein PilY1
MNTNTKNPLRTFLARALAFVLSYGLIVEPVLAGTVTISSTPLATAGSDAILPNLMFVLDASGSMDSDYNGDFVNDNSKCLTRSTGSTNCARGDAPYEAGGANAMNGVSYDPMVNYKPGLKYDGTTVLASSLTLTAVPNDAYGAQSTSNKDLTAGWTDTRFCNGNSLCKRPGADTSGVLVSGTDDLGRTMSAGRFPYRTTNTNSSATIMGLPEMMRQGSFARSSSTVTVTTLHTTTLTTSDFVYPTGSGSSGLDLNTCVAVTSVTANSFTYTSGSSGTISARTGSYRKCVSASFIRNSGSFTSGSLVQVTSTAHGLQTGDLISFFNTGVSTFNASQKAITVVDADTFTYDSGTTTAQTTVTGQWARIGTGLYNQRGTVSGTAVSYFITPIEYCTDVNLNNCVEVIPPATPPSGFTVPAYVRYCQTQEQAFSPAAIGDSSVTTARCRSKFVGSGSTTWIYPRFGWFNRDTITATTATYTRSAARTDCAAAPSCTYAEEMQNFARWWTYYHTRMQMMKTAAGRAFLPFISNPSATPAIPDKLRVGFININPFYLRSSSSTSSNVIISNSSNSPTFSGNYLAISPFNTSSSQAQNWYTTFYNQIPNQSTPLREALSRVGWIYAGKLNQGLTKGIPTSDDPIQAACQRNYTILTTDGYWNGSAGQDFTGGAIGNLDGNDPTTDAPYTQVMVDRTTTGTFDGAAFPQVLRTDTATTQAEQVACVAGNTTTFNGGTQTSCGCSSGQHRIIQRVTSSTHRVVTSNGTVTSDTFLSPTYTFSNVTGCLTAEVITTATPQTNLQQVVCSGNSTVSFSQGSTTTCGCATSPATSQVKQQTRTNTHTVITTDGTVTSDTQGTWTDTFQNITAANGTSGCQSLVVTTVQPTTETQQVLCQGTAAVSWTALGSGANPSGSCQCGTDPNFKMILQRQSTYNKTTVTNDGSTTSTSYSAASASFTPIVACNALRVQTDTGKLDRQQHFCQGTSAISWTAASDGTNSSPSCPCSGSTFDKAVVERQVTYTSRSVQYDGGTPVVTTLGSSSSLIQIPGAACNHKTDTNDLVGATVQESKVCTGGSSVTFVTGNTASCSCSGGRKVILQETITGVTVHNVSIDGVAQPTQYTGGTRTIRYSTNGSTFTTSPITGSSCTSSSLSSTTQTTGGGTPSSSTTGATVTSAQITLASPVVSTVSGPTTTSNGGTTITASMITQSPNPSGAVNAPGGTTTTAGYTVTTADITLNPNPRLTSGTATVTNNGGSRFTTADFTINPNPGALVSGSSTVTQTSEGSANTLADVAMYYYRSDLRGGTDPRGAATGPALNSAGTDVSANVVPAKSGAKDFVTHQHMVTFTVGLADGLLRYQSDYETSASGDFANIKAATNNGCFWVTGVCNWPLPVADDASALDDLWHAAVNGRGQFYLATNAESLATGIQTALTAVNAQVAAAAASATSSPNVTQTDNQIFSTTYETNTWSGKVFAQTIDPATGNVDPTIQWQADTQLLAKVSTTSDTRNLYTLDSGAASKLKSFTWAQLTAAEQAYFTNKCVPASTMTQCTGLNTAQLATANDGASLVGFLRGQTGNEATIFRDRTYIDLANNSAVVQTVLGDTITAKPAFLRNPTFNYADSGYAAFLVANATRSPNVYVGANDGYLHAFNGSTGDERWAYLPHFLMPGLYALADSGYSTLHRYFADGSPETGDVYDTSAGAWKSILVAGVSGGGRGYYAIDVTDPSNPKGLWEFCNDSTLCASSDADLGLTYGNPVIGKRRADGKWVVVVTSGLNNVSPGTTGIGYLYVLDAITGTVLDKISTATGSLGTPSGLMKISAFFDSAATDATFQYVYGGDQLGNVWRFDLSTAPGTVMLMTTLKDASTPARGQPITTRPALTHIGTSRILYIGTGRYLGTPDLSDPGAASGISWQQTLYAFKDKDAEYGVAGDSLRSVANLVQQSLTSVSPTERGVTTNAVDWNTKDGWYVDFNPVFSGVQDSPGEGVNLVDPKLALGTLVVTTNVPASGGASCSVGGSSFDYNFDFKTGQAVSTSAGGVVGRSLGGTITVGVAIVQLPSGAIKSISTGADTSKTTSTVNTSTAGASVKRFSYRVR